MNQTRLPLSDEAVAAPGLAQALRYWARLGCIGFGGPAGQIALMHAELVERRRWLSEGRFMHALNYCMLLPGPEAQQLATYCGWLMHGVRGGIAAGLLFILPSLLLMIGLGWLYMVHGEHPVARGLLYGVQPAVVALVVHAAWRLGRRTLRGSVLRAVALGALAAVALKVPFPLVLLVAAAVGALLPAAPVAATASAAAHPRAWLDDDTPAPAHTLARRRLLVGALAGGLVLGGAVYLSVRGQPLLAEMARFFTQAALLTFGGAYAVLPYVMQAAVDQHGWVTLPQMLTGLALGESTPGPLIMVLSFIGFVGGWQQPMLATPLASGTIAALVVTFFTFLPSFVFILAGAPFVEATRGLPRLQGPLTAISAAVVGVIAHLGLVLAAHVLWPQRAPDVAALAIFAAAALALLRLKRGVLEVLALAALAGLLIQTLR